MAKSEFLQIRVTAAQKAALKRLAEARGLTISELVLSRVLPDAGARVAALVGALVIDEENESYSLAELNDELAGMGSADLQAAAEVDLSALTPRLANYVAAMIEQAATRRGVGRPAFLTPVEPLEEPWFASSLASLRPWLLANSPVAFKRRNLFVDASVGDRV